MSADLWMLLIGLATGLITGLTGASGVAVVVPLLSLLLSFSVHEAIATSLVVDVLASLAITLTYYRHGHVRLGSGAWIALGSVLGAQGGARLAVFVPEADLGAAFGLFLMLLGVTMWHRGGGRAIFARFSGRLGNIESAFYQALVASGLGIGIGISTGITGAGGGLVIFLVLVLVLDFPLHQAIGTSTLIMAITAFSGAVGYTFQGEMDLTSGIVVGAGAVVGGIASATFANESSERLLSRMIGVIFVGLGIITTYFYLTEVGILPTIPIPFSAP